MNTLHRPLHAATLALASVLAAALLLALPAGEANAQRMPVPVVKSTWGGKVPATVKKQVQGVMETVVKGDDRNLELLDADATQGKLFDISPALAECTSADCLTRVGEELATSIGVATSISGEAQIYDMEVIVYDLTTGKTAASERFSCDICTARETATRFAAGFRDALSRAEVKKVEPKKKPTEGKKIKTIAESEGAKKGDDATPAGARTVRVTIATTPSSSEIALDGRPIGTGEVSFEVPEGKYEIQTRADGYETLDTPLRVTGDTEGPVTLEIALTPEPAGGGADSDPAQIIGGGAAIVFGLASAITGGVLLSIDGDTTCSTGSINQCPNVYETTTAGITLLGLGAAGATSGLFLILMDVFGESAPATSESASPSASFGVGATPEGASFIWSTPF